MYISCLLQCAYFLIGKKPVQGTICHVAPPYFLLYIVYIVEFTQLYTPEHARNEPPWLLLSGFCKHHDFAHTSSSLVLNAVQSDAGQEWLLGVQDLNFFANIFRWVHANDYVIDVQVEKQTAGVLTDELSWGQQLTVMSPEGGVAAPEGLTSSGHTVPLKETHLMH